MRYITPSILCALATLAGVVLFLRRYAQSCHPLIQARPDGERAGLSFAGKCHPMEKADRLPVLLITLIYALTAFFQLGDTTAPQLFHDFSGGDTVSVTVYGTPVRASGLRYYPGLGTGGYNVEVSSDGESWSTLWQRKDDPADPDKIVGYYWADAADYEPSYAMTQDYNQLFKWVDIQLDNPIDSQYLRISGRADKSILKLGSFSLIDGEGRPIPFNYGLSDQSPMPDDLKSLFETALVPDKSTWHNSTYFDEIYHARTALEHIEGIYPYEITHPPLGKLILGVGIRLFGMTPFGWRFMGTLFGTLMLPILYVFLKNLFGKTPVAACGTTLFASGFMHLTQTRIATIDTYGVFFILCMYFFMYRYLTLPAGTPFRRGALPLFLSGLMWALGVSAKWTVIYGGLGLAAVYFMGLYQKLRDWPGEDTVRAAKGPWLAATLLFSVFCFILLPLVVYTASYLPYAQALEVDLSLSNTLSGIGRSVPVLFHNLMGKFTGGESFAAQSIPTDSLTGVMANNQWYMLTYHQGVVQPHPYSSRWFQWIVDARPILYYMDNEVTGCTTRFAAFANPAVCWAGLGAVLICGAHSFRRLWSKAAFLGCVGLAAAGLTIRSELGENGVFSSALSAEELARNWVIWLVCLLLYLALCALILLSAPGYSPKAAFIFIAYLSQLAPWWLIGRTTFEYHYFPSLLFLVFALSYLFDGLTAEKWDWQKPVYGFTGLSVGLYVLFYPFLIGLTVSTCYEPFVKWIESWPF